MAVSSSRIARSQLRRLRHLLRAPLCQTRQRLRLRSCRRRPCLVRRSPSRRLAPCHRRPLCGRHQVRRCLPQRCKFMHVVRAVWGCLCMLPLHPAHPLTLMVSPHLPPAHCRPAAAQAAAPAWGGRLPNQGCLCCATCTRSRPGQQQAAPAAGSDPGACGWPGPSAWCRAAALPHPTAHLVGSGRGARQWCGASRRCGGSRS